MSVKTSITNCYRRLSGWVIPYWKIFTLALLGMMIMALTMFLLPILIKQILDGIFVSKDQELIRLVSLMLLVLFVIRGIASYVSTYAINMIGSNLGKDLRLAMFDKLITLPSQNYRELTSDDITKRFNLDIKRATHSITSAITILAKDFFTIIGLIACMFYLNWELSFLMLLIAPMIVLIKQLIHERLNKTSQQILQAIETLIQDLSESIKNYKLIRLYGGQLRENQRLRRKTEQIYRAETQETAIRALIVPLGQMVTNFMLIATTYLVAQQVYNNEIALGEVGSFIAAALLLISPIQRAAGINKYLQRGQKAIENIFSLLDQESELDTGATNINHARGELAFEHVSFRYETQEKFTLNNLSVVIKPGETVAFVESTNNENTALIDLILRFHQPTTGKILLDNHNLADLKLTSLRANIAMISENAILLDDKVAGNIAYGSMRCSNETKITAAARASHAMKFIREMPEGLQTQIGKDGIKLTNKQCQHIAIARALLKNPPILILDGIPVTTDPKSDYLQDALKTLISGRTTLIFTQHLTNLSGLKKVDRIITLKDGHIAKIGKKHPELLAKQKSYTKISKSHLETIN